MKKEVQIIIGVVTLLLLIVIGKYSYEYFKYERNITKEESEKRKIDEYNFEQLEKVKAFLNNEKEYKIRNLSEFNKKYNQHIIPIKNCYYLVSTNYFDEYKGKSKYLFGFELYSDKYIKKYGETDDYGRFYYAYPKYDLPYDKVCFGLGEGSCSDLTFGYFMKTITNPCRD